MWKNKVHVIDVSQSVDHDHPRSLEFLRTDIKNVGDFFSRKGVPVFSERETFDFVINPGGSTDVAPMRRKLMEMEQKRESRTDEERERLEDDDEIFRQQFIPRTLDQVYDVERDTAKVGHGEGDALIYKSLLADPLDENSGGVALHQDSSSDDDSDDSSDFDDDDKKPRGHRFEDKDEKKVCIQRRPENVSNFDSCANCRSKLRSASRGRTKSQSTLRSSSWPRRPGRRGDS
jgi:RIO kinase 1